MKSGQHWGKSPYMVKELSKAPRWVNREQRQDEVPWDGKGGPVDHLHWGLTQVVLPSRGQGAFMGAHPSRPLR